MADRNLKLNIASDSSQLKTDLIAIATQLTQLSQLASAFNAALSGANASSGLQATLTALNSQFQQLSTTTSSFTSDFNNGLNQAAIATEKLNQAQQKTVQAFTQSQSAQERLAQSIANRQKAEEVLSQTISKSTTQQQLDLAKIEIAQQNALKAIATRQKAEESLSQTQNKAAQVSQELSQVAEDSTKHIGLGLGSTIEGFEGMLGGIHSVIGGFEDLVQVGTASLGGILEKALQVQNQVLGLTGTFSSLNDVFVGSKQIEGAEQKLEVLQPAIERSINQVRMIALSISGVTSSQVVDVFKDIAQSSSSANISLEQSVGLVKSFSAGFVGAQIPLQNAGNQIREILNGQINQYTTLAKQLNITNEIVTREKNRGTLVEFLNKKLEGSVAIQAKFSNTIEGIGSNIKEIEEITRAAFGGELLRPITDALRVFYNLIDQNKEQIIGYAQTIAATFVRVGQAVGRVVTAIAPLFGEIVKAFFDSGVSAVLLGQALTTVIDGLSLVASVITTVLTPVVQIFGTDIGKVVLGVGALAYALNAGLAASLLGTVNGFIELGQGSIAFLVASGQRISQIGAEIGENFTLVGSIKAVEAAQVEAAAAATLRIQAAEATAVAEALTAQAATASAAALTYEASAAELSALALASDNFSAIADAEAMSINAAAAVADAEALTVKAAAATASAEAMTVEAVASTASAEAATTAVAGIAGLTVGLLAIVAAAALAAAALVYFTEQSKNADLELESANRETDANFNASLRVVSSLKKLGELRKLNGDLTKEQAKAEGDLLDLGLLRVKENEKEIAFLKEQATLHPDQRPLYESQIKSLEQINGQLSKIKTSSLAVTDYGGAYKVLADRAKIALETIKAGVNEPKFKEQLKILFDTTKAQVESGEITRAQAAERLELIANNTKVDIETRKQAQGEIQKLLNENGKEEIELLKAKQETITSLISEGYLTDVEGSKQTTQLKLKELDIQTENLKKAYAQQLNVIEENSKASLKAYQEAVDNARKDVGNASGEGDRVDKNKILQKAESDLANAVKGFENEKFVARSENEKKSIALVEQRKKAERDGIQQQVAALRGGLERELSGNENLRKKSELATQADIQVLKLGGFQNDRQLEEQTLLAKKQTTDSEIFDKRRLIEFDKTNLASFVGSQKEKEELILKIGGEEASLAKLNLDATDNLIARNKLIYDQKIGVLEIEKTTSDRVSKLLESQNSLLNAQVKLQNAIADAQLKGAENNLTALKEASGLLKAQRDKKMEGLDEESKREIEAEKERKNGIEKERLSRERLAELGISSGTSELGIARQIFNQEQKVLELKARKFEQEQANAKLQLEVSIQQSQIRDKQLEIEAKIALIKAKSSGNKDAIAAALELVALTGEQVKNNQQIAGLQRKTLDETQKSERQTFNQEQEGSQFKNKIEGADAGLVGLQSSKAIEANELATPAKPSEADARKKLADAKTPEKVKGVLDERKQDLAEVANGAVAFEDTSQQIKDNFASLPNSLSATKAGLQEVIAQAKELGENPIFKSREEQAAKQKKAETSQAQTAQQQQTTQSQKAKIEEQVENESNAIKGFNAAATANNAKIADRNKLGAVANDLFGDTTGSLGIGNPKELEATRKANRDADEARKKKENGFFTGGLPPIGETVTVNERGQEAITNLKTLETSLLPNGERQMQFDAPHWIHNAQETRQIRNLGMLDNAPIPDIAFSAIASTLRINNTELLAEMKIQNTLLSQLADGMRKPNVINNFSNDPRPDLTAYRVANQLIRN